MTDEATTDGAANETAPGDPAAPFDAPAFRETLTRAALAIGVPLAAPQVAQCEQFARLVLETNRHTNLTRITEPREMAVKHFADSLSVAPLLPSFRGSVCDVGTGAGFPGVVLKIVRPDLRITLLDSLGKRLRFLETACAALGFEDVSLVHARAEEAGRIPEARAAFDVVTARAVAALPTLLEWCAPLVRVGGSLVAMKAGGIEGEVASAERAAMLLGMRRARVRALTLPAVFGGDEPPVERRLVIYERGVPCPAVYPRASGEIKRAPLSPP